MQKKKAEFRNRRSRIDKAQTCDKTSSTKDIVNEGKEEHSILAKVTRGILIPRRAWRKSLVIRRRVDDERDGLVVGRHRTQRGRSFSGARGVPAQVAARCALQLLVRWHAGSRPAAQYWSPFANWSLTELHCSTTTVARGCSGSLLGEKEASLASLLLSLRSACCSRLCRCSVRLL